MPDALEVWLRGAHIARLSELRPYRYRLDYTESALDTYGEQARILSLALPLSRAPITDTSSTHRPVAAFIEGLLPEGNLRRHLAAAEGVATSDAMALLRVVGAECAGAVQFLPAGTEPSGGRVRELTDAEVTRLVADLPTYHLPDGAHPQASLAGIQDKVLLTARPGGAWGWPEDGAASTHLIKPEPLGGAVARLIQSEDWALRVARAAGLPAAESRLERFAERAAIVVTRYDRDRAGQRQHQEDFCQALGLDPQAKYESSAEAVPRLRRIAALAAPRAEDPTALRRALLAAVTFNVIIGNGDAHSKNYSLLLGSRGQVSLAPLYDIAPLMFLDRRYRSTGQVINGRTNIDWVETDDLIAEAGFWGLPAAAARDTVTSVIERSWDAIRSTTIPAGMETPLHRLERLWRRRSWLPGS